MFYGRNCRDAFTRYQEILGGDLALLTLAEAPSEEPVPPEQADLIIHAALTTDGAYVMGSDDPTGEFRGIQGMSVSVSVDDADEAGRVFDALADDGQVTAPLTETLFSPAFGMCVDRRAVDDRRDIARHAMTDRAAPFVTLRGQSRPDWAWFNDDRDESAAPAQS